MIIFFVTFVYEFLIFFRISFYLIIVTYFITVFSIFSSYCFDIGCELSY